MANDENPITKELPAVGTWKFYDGMTRERFDELRAAGELPAGIGDYDEVQRLVAHAKAHSH